MQIEKIISQIFKIIAEVAPDEDLTDIDPDTPLLDQLELDSVVFLAVMMEVQERYGIEVPEEDYIELTTLNRCAAYLEGRIS
ncbi:MAG: acyl carrier protein [Desulfobacterales bacterium]|nr:acyl carrier protein [Desulfobacterales bacterium]